MSGLPSNISDFSKICRACLTTIDSFKYTLFENVSSDDYSFCTSIEIDKDEELPKTLCNNCYNLLSKFSEFKRTCIKSQRILLTFRSVKKEIVNKLGVTEPQETQECNDEIDDWPFDNGQLKINFTTDNVCKEDIIMKQEELVDSNETDYDSTAFSGGAKENKDHERLKIKISKRRKNYACKFCNKEFSKLNEYRIHKSLHKKKIMIIKCKYCNKTFVTWSGLRRHHANWHARVSLSSVTCRTCGKITNSRETLLAHKKLHKKQRLFICNVCGKSYTSSNNLYSHLETHKENRERQYTCEHCGKKFFTKKCILSHLSRCHTGRKFICQICSYPFTDKYNLSKHLQTHEGKKYFKCKICDKSFSTRQISIEHQRIHSGERPFSCSYCPKSFISKKRLSEHHRTHTGEKPHKCSICDHRFTQRGTLTRHMKIHNRPLINCNKMK
ncbi:unnamed protein product [Euphydryas editha]|uniref:Uncharacterized protein n=1 Tax=Euphydryas editha TaxID=104508 RepID=A0AAU9UUX4_EUPED|nr:unnamed protein product [Euphydryas editha]